MIRDPKHEALLKAVVRAVAKDGLENTTTRSIGQMAGVKDAYIYRYYHDKEELICRAFFDEAKAFASLVIRHIELAKASTFTSNHEALYFIFSPSWQYLLDNPDISKFCLYYYHSSSFTRFATHKYSEKVLEILEHIVSLIPTYVDTGVLLNHILTTMFSFAVQVSEGILPDSPQTTDFVFRQLYALFDGHVDQERERMVCR